MDRELDDYDVAPPRAASLIESLRAFGYDLPSAIADLVDNSITAGASKIWIDFHWAGQASVISVTDDGSGMRECNLVDAMRLGSRNPLEARDGNDLGRFGLGLKTASFSQCRRLTVKTRTIDSEPATRCWDLDHVADVDEWQLLRTGDDTAEPYWKRISALAQGTTVLWQKLDRITAHTVVENDKHHQSFLEHAEKVRKHLALVFHRLMSENPTVEIILNDRLVSGWDPFLLTEPATQILAETRLSLRDGSVDIRPFILPHQSKISRTVFDTAAGPKGWNAHQGFYIYRGHRLLVAGDWLGFGWAKEEHYKLARIMVDIPNSLDDEWQIDVTKSRAIPPHCLRGDLHRIGARTRADAKRVYSHRGSRVVASAESDRVYAWEPVSRHDKLSYRLNREHPLIKNAYVASTNKGAFSALLRMIEETVPFQHITFENSERPGTLAGPFDHVRENDVREIMEQAYDALVGTGYGCEEALNRLRTIWPFEQFPSILQAIREAKRHE